MPSPEPPQSRSSQPNPLLSQPLLILDGGLGTALEQQPYNVRFSSAETPLWSSHLLISSPQTLADVHQRFVVEGGAQIVLTASYQASFEGFARTRVIDAKNLNGVGEIAEGQAEGGIGVADAARLMRNSVSLARDAFGQAGGDERREGLVALSLGAFGAILIPGAEYSGDYGDGPKEGLAAWHRRRIEVFRGREETWRDVDVVAFETLPRLDEVSAVRQVMTQLGHVGTSDRKPWWVCCVFPGEEQDGGFRLPDGSTVRDVVETMLGGADSKPWGIGINCTKIWKMKNLIKEFEQAVREGGHEPPRLVIYPDGAGESVYNVVTQEWEERSETRGPVKSWDEEMADLVGEVQRSGFWPGIVVGGCCKTGPGEIRVLSGRLKELQN